MNCTVVDRELVSCMFYSPTFYTVYGEYFLVCTAQMRARCRDYCTANILAGSLTPFLIVFICVLLVPSRCSFAWRVN